MHYCFVLPVDWSVSGQSVIRGDQEARAKHTGLDKVSHVRPLRTHPASFICSLLRIAHSKSWNLSPSKGFPETGGCPNLYWSSTWTADSDCHRFPQIPTPLSMDHRDSCGQICATLHQPRDQTPRCTTSHDPVIVANVPDPHWSFASSLYFWWCLRSAGKCPTLQTSDRYMALLCREHLTSPLWRGSRRTVTMAEHQPASPLHNRYERASPDRRCLSTGTPSVVLAERVASLKLDRRPHRFSPRKRRQYIAHREVRHTTKTTACLAEFGLSLTYSIEFVKVSPHGRSDGNTS